MRPTCSGYFSGGGLLEIGFQQAGVEMIQSLDLDKHAVRHMHMNRQYFNHRIVHDDIKNQLVVDQPDTDMISGTYPCNKYAEIADLHGARTGEDLYLEFFRMLAIKQPAMYVLENVPGMKKFPVVMEAMTKLPGYYINIFCPLDASIWLPQRRERLILFGTRKPFSIYPPPQPKKRKSLKDIIEKDAVVDVNDTVISRLDGAYRDKPIVVDPNDKDAVAPTCVAHYAKDMGTRLVVDKNYDRGVRPFTIREYARLQGVPDDYVFTKQRIAYRIIGNGVPVDMGRWIGEQAVRYFNQSKVA